MKTKKLVAATIVWSLCIFASAPTARAQGALTPPGPPAPTMKSLDQIEPRFPISLIPTNLSVSGSYYLTTNLTQKTVGTSGITISTNDITIDLNGFALIGTNGTPPGIASDGLDRRMNICVRNGTIRNWSDGLASIGGGNVLIDHVRIYNNTGNGINAFGDCIATECYIASNGLNGIVVRGTGYIRDCILDENAHNGIQVEADSVVTENNCAGFSATSGTNAAILATGGGNRIEGNFVDFCDSGVVVIGTGNLVTRNTAHNTTTNFLIVPGNLAGPTLTSLTGLTNNPFANISF